MESSHLVLSLINLFLLGSPNEHVLCVQPVWVDDIFNQPRWEDFVTRLARHTIFVSLCRFFIAEYLMA